MAINIISGKYRGRKLYSPPKSSQLRPISNKNLENILNILYSGGLLAKCNIKITEIDLLDLFAGTGIFTFENLSLGINSAILVDNNQNNLNIIKKNADKLQEKNISVINHDLSRSLPKFNSKFHLIFLDPPYSRDLSLNILSDLCRYDYCHKDHLIIIEHHQKDDLKIDEKKFNLIKFKKYGNSAFSFLQKLA